MVSPFCSGGPQDFTVRMLYLEFPPLISSPKALPDGFLSGNLILTVDQRLSPSSLYLQGEEGKPRKMEAKRKWRQPESTHWINTSR